MAADLLVFQNGTPVKDAADWKRRRQELVELLAREEYGITPMLPELWAKGEVKETITKVASGHAQTERVEITVPTPGGEFRFPIWLTLPRAEHPVPVFVFLNFQPDLYDMYYPLEEIIDHGFGIAVLYYRDVTSDDGDFTNGLAGCFGADRRGKDAWGKIGMWAWAASRVLDYLLTRPEVDGKHVAVIGHSRLGKTALWAGAQDERFALAVSNDSGCCGASLEEEKHEGAETYEAILSRFPYWFCENFAAYAHRKAPFDQHMLVAALAPRPVAVGSADGDLWADPFTEQRSCVLAGRVYPMLGKQGYLGKTEAAVTGDSFVEGDVHYHLRNGIHFLGRADWLEYMRFAEKQFGMKGCPSDK